jgi:hypothetical protein
MDLCRIISQYLTSVNLFDTETDDEHVRKNEILSTRIYIIILITILSLFGLYTALLSQTSIITITTPTQRQYEELILKFSSSLQCPCEYISTPYQQFINITPEYNEICLSDFVGQKWIDYLFYENTSYYFQLDFRHSASSKFQILQTLCQQAQNTIDDSLEEFYSTQFITNQLVSTIIFDAQADAFIELFKQTTPPLFQNLLTLIRQTITSNELFSAIELHFALEFILEDGYAYIIMNNIYYEEEVQQGKNFDCYCDSSTICQLPEGIYADTDRYDFAGSDWDYNDDVNATTSGITATFLIPGMFASCKPIESLMISTSECLYEQTCLNQIAAYIPYSSTSVDSFSVLNQSESIRKTTIETLANNLFLEGWIINTSYEKYFNACQPLFCQYTDEHKNSFVRVLAAIISLYGGLRVVLTLLIPIIVRFMRKKKTQQQIDLNINSPKSKSYILVFICFFNYRFELYDLTEQRKKCI